VRAQGEVPIYVISLNLFFVIYAPGLHLTFKPVPFLIVIELILAALTRSTLREFPPYGDLFFISCSPWFFFFVLYQIACFPMTASPYFVSPCFKVGATFLNAF